MNKIPKFLFLPIVSTILFPINAEENLVNWKGPVIGMTRLKAPWYAPEFYVEKKMKDSIPEYSSINGLQTKLYSLEIDSSLFGGIYLWKNEKFARDWWNQSFFDRVNKKYGANNTIELKQAIFINSNQNRKIEIEDHWIKIKRYSIPPEAFSKLNKHFENKVSDFQKKSGYTALWIAGCENFEIEIITVWSEKAKMEEMDYSELIQGNWKEIGTILTKSPIQLNNKL